MNGAMKAFEGGTFEALYYKKNGHAIWLQIEITPIRNEQAVVVLFLSTYRDITIFKGQTRTQTDSRRIIFILTRICSKFINGKYWVATQELGIKC